MSIYILSFEDAERVASVLGPFSKLEGAQEYAEKDFGNSPLQWVRQSDDVFIQETWMSDETDAGEYYTIVKFEMDPEFVPPTEAEYDDDDVPDYWPPADASGYRPPPVFEPWRD